MQIDNTPPPKKKKKKKKRRYGEMYHMNSPKMNDLIAEK